MIRVVGQGTESGYIYIYSIVIMAIRLNLKQEILTDAKESVLHLLPCKIHGNETALVSSCFTPYIRKNDEYLTTSFRGYPLQGKTITLPKGYTGLVLHETKGVQLKSEKRNLFTTGKFSKFTYWNYDKTPTNNDAVTAALDWVDIADVLHSVEDDTSD